MFEFKPDFESVMNRYEAWWHGAILDRPLVSIAYPKPADQCRPLPVAQHASIRDRWMDAGYVAECALARLGNAVFAADSLPVVYPNLGPEVFSAFYGCEIEYGESTAWSKPVLLDWSEDSLARLKLDTSNFYYRKLIEMTDALLETGRNRFIVGYTDLHGGGDAIAAFRDPQELLLDTIEHSAEVKALCDRITDDFLRFYDFLHDKLTAAGMPSTTWCPVIGHGRVHIPSNDFSCMISAACFEDLFIPGIIRECRHMDRCLYHLDGPQALRYLDRLLDIPEIQAIQWVPGAGHDRWTDSIEVYQRIQSRGKSMQIHSVPVQELPILFESLAPEGVWVSHIGGINTREDADAALRQISAWTRKR